MASTSTDPELLEESSGSEDEQPELQATEDSVEAEESGDEEEELPLPVSGSAPVETKENKLPPPSEYVAPPPPVPRGRGAAKKEGARCDWVMTSGARRGETCAKPAKEHGLCTPHANTVSGRAMVAARSGSTSSAGAPEPTQSVKPAKAVKPVKPAKLERTFQHWGSEGEDDGVTMSPADFLSIFSDINASKAKMAARGPAKARKPVVEKQVATETPEPKKEKKVAQPKEEKKEPVPVKAPEPAPPPQRRMIR